MWDLASDCLRRVHKEINSGTKWSAAGASQEVKSSFQVKDIMEVVQNNQAGLSNTICKFFSKENPKGNRCLVIDEVKMFKKEHKTTDFTLAKQCV